MTPIGMTSIPVRVKDLEHEITFHVNEQSAETILGADTCASLHLVQRVHSEQVPKDVL